MLVFSAFFACPLHAAPSDLKLGNAMCLMSMLVCFHSVCLDVVSSMFSVPVRRGGPTLI